MRFEESPYPGLSTDSLAGSVEGLFGVVVSGVKIVREYGFLSSISTHLLLLSSFFSCNLGKSARLFPFLVLEQVVAAAIVIAGGGSERGGIERGEEGEEELSWRLELDWDI